MSQQISPYSTDTLAIRYGLLIGAISVALTVVLYMINPVLAYTSLLVLFLSLALVITLLVVLGLDIRKKMGGFWSFGKAYSTLMIMAALMVLVSIIAGFILFKFVDTALPQKINDATQEVTASRLEKFGADQGTIDKANKQFEDGEFIAKMQPTPKNELINFGGAIIIYAIVNLIIAACIKKKPPMFAPVLDDPEV